MRFNVTIFSGLINPTGIACDGQDEARAIFDEFLCRSSLLPPMRKNYSEAPAIRASFIVFGRPSATQ
jgi:hypothetical protein